MGSDSSIPISSGTGTDVDTFLLAGGGHQQIVREARATTENDDSWPVVTTAATSRIAADINRVGMRMTSFATGRVYIRFDSTAPTAANAHWFLDPDERWELPNDVVQLAISFTGAVAGGTINTHWGLAS